MKPWTSDCKTQGRDGDVEYTDEQLETFDKVWLCVGAVILIPSAIAMVVGTVWSLAAIWDWLLGMLS